MALFSLVVALVAIAGVVALALTVAKLGQAVMELRQAAESPERTPALPAMAVSSPLEGVRIAIAIEQDHARDTFAAMLKARLEALDAEVRVVAMDEANGLRSEWGQRRDPPDILISGALVCDGYAEIYRKVELTFATRHGVIGDWIEEPLENGRQANLASGVVGKVAASLDQAVRRAERLGALRELRE